MAPYECRLTPRQPPLRRPSNEENKNVRVNINRSKGTGRTRHETQSSLPRLQQRTCCLCIQFGSQRWNGCAR